MVRSAVLAPSFDPILPWGQEYLWRWFVELSQGRQDGLNGPMALSWQEMSEWASLTCTTPRSDEWRVLRAMDAAFLAAVRDKGNTTSHPDAVPTGRLLTPELFDALF